MAEIIKMNPDTLTVSELLNRSCDLKGCIILGKNPDGSHYFGVASLSSAEIVYMMELCKLYLLKLEDL